MLLDKSQVQVLTRDRVKSFPSPEEETRSEREKSLG